jgi:ABC-type transport system involved in multi-copper enzyme maturation permease subunit
MIRLIHAQVIGLRTLRSTYAVLAGIVAAVLVMVLADLGTNAGSAYIDPPALREPVLIAVGVIITIIVCVFAATAVAGDYRYKTIDHRLLAAPRRSRLLLAALATYTMFALVVAALAMGLALAIALPLVASHDLSLGLTPAAVVAPVVAVALFAVIGVAVGTGCRSQTAAILVIVGWFPAEKLLGLALGDSAAYLPYGLVNQVLGLEGSTVGRGTAFACLGCYAVAAGLLAAIVLTRRDVN